MKWWKKENGQATVEFALVLPILVLLIFGMIDFGWLFYHKIEVINASREGARYAVVHWDDMHYVEQDTIDRVESFTDADVVSIEAGAVNIKVTVKKDVRVLTGVTSTFLGDTVSLQSSCTMKKE